jgi:hypothetical protein
MEKSFLSFDKFLAANCPWFKIDAQVHEIVKLLNLYTWGDPRFEKNFPASMKLSVRADEKSEVVTVQEKFSFNKGIMLVGNVGSGKTMLMECWNLYLQYLGGGGPFAVNVIPRLSEEYTEQGKPVLDKIKGKHRFFDELCKLDVTGVPRDENVLYMGNRILMGEKVIDIRYESAMPLGYLTHFTTNEDPASIARIYGMRALSRLAQMCNIIPLLGRDRRFSEAPIVNIKQQFDFVRDSIRQQRDLKEEELSMARAKNAMDAKFSTFKAMNDDGVFGILDFDLLRSFGVQVCKDEELNEVYMERALVERRMKLERTFTKGARDLLAMHESGHLSQTERGEVIAVAKRLAVVHYAQAITQLGKDSFFN